MASSSSSASACAARSGSILSTLFFLQLLLLAVALSGATQYPLPSPSHSHSPKKLPLPLPLPLQTSRPYNIAHRGSNGEIPEETTAAYLRAIEEGADFIETDILSTKDGVLICFHDLILDDTTDVANYTNFANRKTTYQVQGSNVTGYFVVDFTIEELKSLRVKQRYPFRDQQYNWKYPIITFEEFIAIGLKAKRTVGIYPEIKNPVFINQHSYWEITSDSYLQFIRNYVVGIGPWKDTIVPVVNNYLRPPTDLVAKAHAHNLQVHPYTYRNENQFLHFDFHQDPYAEYDYWLRYIRVDGLFTDFTGSLHNYQEWTSPVKNVKSADALLRAISGMISEYERS